MLFNNIVGQQLLKNKFISDINEGRIPHAMLFTGEAGYGTLPLALAYAQYLSCQNPKENDACNECPSCIKWRKLIHPDAHFLYPIVKNVKKKKELCQDFLAEWRQQISESPYFSINEWLNTIEAENGQAIIYAKESDEISKTLSLKSSEGGYKISIIWLPERLHEVCANKLLKLLEEPPQKTLFILISENPEFILSTILSRVQRVNVHPIETNDIKNYIMAERQIDEDLARSIAHSSNGDLIKAKEILDSNKEKQYYLEKFISLMRLSYQRKIKEMKQWSEEIASLGRERQKSFFSYCQYMIRENFIFNLKREEINYMIPAEENFSQKFSPFINERNIIEMMSEIELAERHIEQNVNAKIVCFDFALKMIVLLKQ